MKSVKLFLYLVFIIIVTSCGTNEEVSTDLNAKSSTYTERVELDELVNKLRSREPELALFIENNPVSNLKANSGKTNYYFDTKNIVAIKNDKNEAAYSIPLYIKTEKRANILNTLSVEITPTHIDVKLITMEGLDDGTVRYYASLFDTDQTKSVTQKTNRFDCYCVSIARDCGCCSSHADGGCTHPDVITSCGCSGSGFSEPEPSSPTPPTKTSWSGGSGGGTTYAANGNGVYFALQKMFKPDYEFNLLEKYTIVNNYPYSKLLIDYLNTEGYTPVNKAFVVQMIYNLEAGLFETTTQLRSTIQNFNYSQKSPFDVDLSSILNNLTLPENEKFKNVYDALATSPEFQKLFINLFENSTKYNVKFQIGNLTSGASGDTQTNLINPTNNVITIDANFIKNNSKLVVAKTIIHECIHAFLNVKLCDGQLGNIPNINNNDFYNIVNQSYNGFNNDQAQHNFIYTYILPIMEKILMEVKDKLVLVDDNTEITSRTLRPLYPNPNPGVPFIWSTCLQNISLSGLQNSSFFKKEIGTFDSSGNPTIIIDTIKMNNYNQYNNLCKNVLRQ